MRRGQKGHVDSNRYGKWHMFWIRCLYLFRGPIFAFFWRVWLGGQRNYVMPATMGLPDNGRAPWRSCACIFISLRRRGFENGTRLQNDYLKKTDFLVLEACVYGQYFVLNKKKCRDTKRSGQCLTVFLNMIFLDYIIT